MLTVEKMRILVVDDESGFQRVMRKILEKADFHVECVDNGKAALNLLKKKSFDLVLSDLIMDGIDGIKLLKEIKSLNKDIYVIIITGYGTIENAVEAMKLGAFSYFVKSHDPEALLLEIDKIRRMIFLEKENSLLKKQDNQIEALLKSKNPVFSEVLEIAKLAAESNSNILITGESGVGKEILAKYIHSVSPRKDNSFVAVNCHSFSDSLLESELYGHEKGAFTGSIGRRIGRFEAANKGTLFLDEIGDMSLDTQVKILRNIENKSIERIGSNMQLKIDFRLISATNKDLMKSIREGKFREDLYYRISTINIEIPPLRDRREDIPDLVDYWFKKIKDNLKKDISHIDDEVLEYLYSYDYPGNIRELRNIIERLVVLCRNSNISSNDITKVHGFDSQPNLLNMSLKDARYAFEKEFIENALKKNRYNIKKTSEILVISKRQLFNKLSQYNLRLRDRS